MSRLNKTYKLKPAILTGNEKKFGVEHHTVSTSNLPTQCVLRTVFPEYVPSILDQGQLGDCVGNELSNAMKFCLTKEYGKVVLSPSRLFLYYFGRLFEGSPVTEDTGMSISGACGAVSKYGCCSERNWGYDITKFTVQPPRPCIIAAHSHTPQYQFLQVPQDLTHIKQALYSGYPVIIGIQVYSSFESDTVAQTGVVPMPDTTKEMLLGGHAVLLISWSDDTQTFTCQNSWTDAWGNKGCFTIPYAYLIDPNLSNDFCQVRYFK